MTAESLLSWLDLNEEGRRKMQEQLALLNDPDTVDVLGLGQVRDVFSNLFFPGTSTLWRRARYMLFVPWIYRDLELHGTGREDGAQAARRRQIRLIRALKGGGGDTDGLIGARTDEPQRMPDELVWNGLRVWGIRRREGSLGKYRRSLETADQQRFGVARGDFDEVLDAESGSWWHELVPLAPTDFLDLTDFDLTATEAGFLRDQLEENADRSLLARFTSGRPLRPDCDFPWQEQDGVKRLDSEMQDALDHARIFSYAMQGTGLLYSLYVARARGGDNAQQLAERTAEWSERLSDEGVRTELKTWTRRRASFWALIRTHNRGLRIGTEEFVDSWIAHAIQPASGLLDDHGCLELIRKREWQVKRQLARLSNRKALDRARDEAGTGQLDYRWRQGQRIVNDIAGGLATRVT